MVAWGPKAISMKRLHWTHVVRTVYPRRVPTCLYKLTPKLIRCRSASPVVPTIIKNILEGKSLPVYGDGTNVRDWLYVEDHCKAIDLVIHKGRAGEVYNVGGHNEKQNIEIVKLTISTIRRLMTEQPEYRRILKKKEIGADGQISTGSTTA